MRTIVVSACVLVLSLGLGFGGVLVNEEIETPFAVFVPCANGGLGEIVSTDDLRLHVLVTQTIDGNGGIHLNFHFQPKGGSGVGEDTGDVYRGTGLTRESISVAGGGLPLTDTFVNNFRWIGPGRDNNLLVQDRLHITINANGDVTVLRFDSSVECR